MHPCKSKSQSSNLTSTILMQKMKHKNRTKTPSLKVNQLIIIPKIMTNKITQ